MENKLWLETEDVHENLDKPQDECGVFGIYRKEGKGVVADTYHALYALQHRGQDSCGMCVNTDGVMKKYRESGLVTDVLPATCWKRSRRATWPWATAAMHRRI